MKLLKTISKWYSSPKSTSMIVAGGLLLGISIFGGMKLGEMSDFKSARTQKPHLTFPIKYDPIKTHFVYRPITKDVEQYVRFGQNKKTLTAKVKDADSLNDISWRVYSVKPKVFLKENSQSFNDNPVTNFTFSESFDKKGQYVIDIVSHDKKGNEYHESLPCRIN